MNIELTIEERVNLDKILDHYKSLQKFVWFEEMGELTQVISKTERYGASYVPKIREEMADVLVCLLEMCSYYDISPDEICLLGEQKIDRTLRRMNDKNL